MYITEPWFVARKAKNADAAALRRVFSTPRETKLGGEMHVLFVGRCTSDANASDFDGLMLPGGVANPDRLRTDTAAVRFAKSMWTTGKPIAAICHGPWTLIEAGIVPDRTITSWPSLRTDVRNAGGNWVDEEVHVDAGLVTSRKPDDLPAFNAKMIEEFQEVDHSSKP